MREPTQKANSCSIKLTELIKKKIIAAGGIISFADFMQTALYNKNWGYYNNKFEKFGENGDFITAPMLGQLFSSCVANQCLNIFKQSSLQYNILEIGAGNGQLAFQLIPKLGSYIDNYLILETSKTLKEQQKRSILFKDLDLQTQKKILWINKLPKDFFGIIIANEFLDALPVHLFTIKNQKIFEKAVTLKNNNFAFIDLKAKGILLKKIKKLPVKYFLNNVQNYNSEICLLISKTIKNISNCLKEGSILFFDYGFLENEYYHPDRDCGTLTCYYQHSNHYEPFFLPGLQDLTAHVDFSLIIKTAQKNSLQLMDFCSLSNFLMKNKLEQIFSEQLKISNERQKYLLNQELTALMSPGEMGEIFKTLHLTKILKYNKTAILGNKNIRFV